jgi:glyoxylase-like metal-dependent hydrolase (beta-lactamase superfamily II)
LTQVRPPIFTDKEYSVRCFRSSYLASNSYVLECSEHIYVVDSGYNDDSLIEYLESINKPVLAVLLTHGHFDHAGTASELVSRFCCPVFVLEDEKRTLKQNNFLLKALQQKPQFLMPTCDFVKDGFKFDGFEFRSCPGHTPGSALISFRNLVFTGDSVYAKGLNLVSLPGEDEITLRRSLNSHRGLLMHSFAVFPGHGLSTSGEKLFKENIQLSSFLAEEL